MSNATILHLFTTIDDPFNAYTSSMANYNSGNVVNLNFLNNSCDNNNIFNNSSNNKDNASTQVQFGLTVVAPISSGAVRTNGTGLGLPTRGIRTAFYAIITR